MNTSTPDAARDSAVANIHGLQYVLLTPGEDRGYTPFQGFGVDIANFPFITLIEVLATLPATPYEVFFDQSHLRKRRYPWFQKRALVIGMPSFQAFLTDFDSNNVTLVIIGLTGQIEAARNLLGGINAIFITIASVEGAVSISDHTGHPAQLIDVPIRDRIALAPEPPTRSVLARPLRDPFPEGTESSRGAGVTAANETLSISLGHAYADTHPIGPKERDAYVEAILASTARARELIGDSSTDIVLYAPSILRHLHAFGSAFWNGMLRRIPERAHREMILNGVFRNPEYSGFSMEVPDEALPGNPYDDPVAATIIATRQIELRLTAAGIAALASSRLQPALRLPNSVNFHTAELREIERHSGRTDPRGRRLLQESYRVLVDSYSRQISQRLLDDIRQFSESITIVADAPVEWVRIDGLPLMIRQEVSRIGMTPGNLMLQQCIQSGTVIVPVDALNEVLVVRSFSHDDPIRNVLETALDGYDISRLNIRIVDVNHRDELVTHLNEFNGMLLVFDCHGGHDGLDSHGWLRIGNDKVDPWQLSREARIPPIVVLSACSTFALAGSHASVANGLIRSGAITVIGTFLPVNAALSAVFVARLLYRVDAFLPALKSIGKNSVTWRTLISTFLRMSYVTDLMHFLIYTKRWLPEEMFARIAIKSNYDINALRPDWYRRLMRRISRVSRRSEVEIQTAIDTETPLLETMYYCQIGRPDLICIFLGDTPLPGDNPD